jgi:hypothetical protein
MPKADGFDDDLEDNDPDPLENPSRDLSRPVRKLAAAVLLRAVLDSKVRDRYAREDAAKFLYPRSECARAHLHLFARLAGLSPDWLDKCLIRTTNSPLPHIRHCQKCKSPTPPSGFSPHPGSGPPPYCRQCGEVTTVYAKKRPNPHG